MVTPHDLSEAEARLENLQQIFLRSHGWEYTCNTPGSFCLWRRDFADLDAERQAWDVAHRAGEPGRPSASKPYGVITAPTGLALSITQAVLVREEEEEGS